MELELELELGKLANKAWNMDLSTEKKINCQTCSIPYYLKTSVPKGKNKQG